MKALVYDNERDAKAVSADALFQRKKGRVDPRDVSKYLWEIRETSDNKWAVLVGESIEDYSAVDYSETTYDEDGEAIVTDYTAPETSVTDVNLI